MTPSSGANRRRRPTARRLGAAVVALVLWATLAGAQTGPGDLDPTFGETVVNTHGQVFDGGIVFTDFGTFSETAFALFPLPDGKLLAVGQGNYNSSPPLVALARYLPDGTLDPDFGTGGTVLRATGVGVGGVKGGTLQPDGKPVAVGATYAYQGYRWYHFLVMRFLPDGTLDPSFGPVGPVRADGTPLDSPESLALVPGMSATHIIDGEHALANAAAVAPDGKLVVVGRAYIRPKGYQFAVVRYHPNGAPDASFGARGTVWTPVSPLESSVNAEAFAVVVQPDGKPVVAGKAKIGWTSGNDNEAFALVRYLADGSLDPSFGAGGIVLTAFDTLSEAAHALALQPDGKLVAVGRARTGGKHQWALARYLPDGTLDPDFGTGGTVVTSIDRNDQAQAVVLQPDGKLVVAGWANNCCHDDVALARYLPDGTLDPGFGTGGTVVTHLSTAPHPNGSWVLAVALQPDGKLVAAGNAGISTGTRVALARYAGTGGAVPPEAPTAVSATAGDRQATVAWSPPASDGGSPLTGYTVRATDGSAEVTVDGATTTATVTGLTNGVTYTFVVRATNAEGPGPWSDPSNPVTPAGPPGGSSNVTAEAGDGRATVSWEAPADDGGSPVDWYTVTASGSGGQRAMVDGATTTAVVPGLTNGVAYTFTVIATNAVGPGPAAGPSNAVVPFGNPRAPTNVSAVPGDGQATVSWDPPASDGGSPITGYTVTAGPDGPTVTVGTATTSVTVTGLTNGLVYTFTVFATNAAGPGPAAPSPPVLVGPPPGAPEYVLAVAGPGAGQATVTWYPYPAGMSMVLSYTVTAAPGGETVTVGGRVTTAVVSGLTSGAVSTFTVQGATDRGPAPASLSSNPVITP